MKKFHITIKNNETGEILRDLDTCAIIGAFDVDEEGTGCLVCTACNAIELAATADAAVTAALKATHHLPRGMQDTVLENNGLKRRTNFLEKILGSITNENNN